MARHLVKVTTAIVKEPFSATQSIFGRGFERDFALKKKIKSAKSH